MHVLVAELCSMFPPMIQVPCTTVDKARTPAQFLLREAVPREASCHRVMAEPAPHHPHPPARGSGSRPTPVHRYATVAVSVSAI